MSTVRNWFKRQQRRGVLLGRDELAGQLNSMDVYKARGKGENVAHFLEMHCAGQLLVDRKSGREKVIHVPRRGCW